MNACKTQQQHNSQRGGTDAPVTLDKEPKLTPNYVPFILYVNKIRMNCVDLVSMQERKLSIEIKHKTKQNASREAGAAPNSQGEILNQLHRLNQTGGEVCFHQTDLIICRDFTLRRRNILCEQGQLMSLHTADSECV